MLNNRARVEHLHEGDALEFLGERVVIYATPSLDLSCLCYEIAGRFFTGYAHIPGIKVFTGFPKLDRQLAKVSR